MIASERQKIPDEIATELAFLRQQAPYWKELHARALERIADLEKAHGEQVAALRERLKEAQERVEEFHAANEALRALVKLRTKQAFGKKSERKRTSRTKGGPGKGAGGKRRGRRKHEHLPASEQIVDVSPEQKVCSCCGKPRVAIGEAVSEFIEVEVRGHVRRIRRPEYAKTCTCPGEKAIVAAPAPARLIPGSLLGISVWVLVLLDKFYYQRPTYRLVAQLESYGIPLARSTLVEGMQRLAPLFAPLVEAIRDRVRAARVRQADETGWPVFIEIEGKKGSRWQLWVFLCADAVYFKLDPSRSSAVVEEVLGANVEGTLVVDRYSAYKAFVVRNGNKLLLAFCWAHVRRDFLTLEQTNPKLAAWAHAWVNRIDVLWKLNDDRREVRARLGEDLKQKEAVVAQIKSMKAVFGNQLVDSAKLDPAQRKALKSLARHWDGLTLFVENPEIPMDNNASEREHRGPVVGRKNYYGSRAKWSGLLAATLFSVFHTLARHGLNPQLWLTAYLTECAENGGKPPADATSWLPWNLPEDRRADWALQRESHEHDPTKPDEPPILRPDLQPRGDRLDPPGPPAAVAA